MRQAIVAGIAVALACGSLGCQASARGWESSDLPTHDRQRAFDAAREVLGEHFELDRVNWARGEIETRPKGFEGPREGTLADVRGAGGAWRRAVACRIGRDGLTIVASVRVRMEREATAAAAAMYQTGTDERASEVPRTEPAPGPRGAYPGDKVWMEVGWDAALAREVLSEIASRVGEAERREQVPTGQTPADMAEETRRIGAEEGF